MTRLHLFSMLLIATLSMPAFSADEDTVAMVNGVAIPKSRFDLLLSSQTTQGQEDTPEFREELREIMITREVLAQESLRRSLDKSDGYTQQMDAMKQQLLLTLLFNTLVLEMEPTAEQLQAEYGRVKDETAKLGDMEYHVRHILVKDEAVATDIIAQLEGGADFTVLANENSEDSGSKETGGDLGWAPPQRYVKPFAEAVVALDKGGMTSTPVKTDFGFHIIEVVDTRTTPFPPFDQVKEEIRKQMLAKSRDDMIGGLRDGATIEITGSISAD